jgi:hypothetical protein
MNGNNNSIQFLIYIRAELNSRGLIITIWRENKTKTTKEKYGYKQINNK